MDKERIRDLLQDATAERRIQSKPPLYTPEERRRFLGEKQEKKDTKGA